MSELIIRHDQIEGTRLDGTARGDGAAEVVKPLGWRWGRTQGVWYVPASRYGLAPRARIDAARAALERAGFAVQVEIEETSADVAQIEQVRAERAEARAERLQARADRLQGQSEGAYERSHELVAGIPMGQPVLVDHYSARADVRRRNRSWELLGRSVELGRAAEDTRRAAAIAGSWRDARHAPVTVANRIERLGADVRRLDRAAADTRQRAGECPSEAQERYLERVGAERADLAAQLTYWEQVRAEQIASGAVVAYGPENVKPGDAVRVRGAWYKVLRSNRKSATVEGEWGARRTPWPEVSEHRAAGHH